MRRNTLPVRSGTLTLLLFGCHRPAVIPFGQSPYCDSPVPIRHTARKSKIDATAFR